MFRPVLCLALAVPTAVLVAGPARAEQPTCWGRAATVVGTPGDDRLVGTSGPDVIAGLDGDDRIDGLAGDDLLCGGPGADVLLGGYGDDELHDGLDRRDQRGRRTVITGDVLDGGLGDDWIKPRTDYDGRRVLVAQPDIVTFAESPGPVHVDLREHTATGYGNDTLFHDHSFEVDGSRYDDVLLGSGYSETLDGGLGNDTIDGRNGRDAVVDHHGDDELAGGQGDDLVIDDRGTGTVDGGGGFDWIIAASSQPMTALGGDGFDLIWRWITPGPTGTIDGGPGGNELEAMTQLWFDDEHRTAVLDRAAGTAVVRSGERTQTTTFSNIGAFILEESDWTYLGTDEPDFVQVLGGSLDARTLGGDDTMFGEDRDDTLAGGDGTDTAWGGGGHNTCTDVEEGDCDGYPHFRARPTLHGHSLREILRDWISRRAV